MQPLFISPDSSAIWSCLSSLYWRLKRTSAISMSFLSTENVICSSSSCFTRIVELSSPRADLWRTEKKKQKRKQQVSCYVLDCSTAHQPIRAHNWKNKSKYLCRLSLPLRPVTQQARAYPGFCNMKRLGVFLLPQDGMLVHCRVTPPPPSIKYAGTHLYTWVEKGTTILKCLTQELNGCSAAARARIRTHRSRGHRISL